MFLECRIYLAFLLTLLSGVLTSFNPKESRRFYNAIYWPTT